jgi:Resolvase, N terminal domain
MSDERRFLPGPVLSGMKAIAYLRVSTGSQDLANQKLGILDYARQKRFAIDRFVEVQVSSRKSRAQRGIEDLLGTLAAGDRLVVSELWRLGRSLGQVIQIVEELVQWFGISRVTGDTKGVRIRLTRADQSACAGGSVFKTGSS